MITAFHQTIIEIPQWGRVTLIEALWLLSGLMALCFAVLRIRPLWDDYQSSKRVGEEDLCVIAFGYLRREALRVATALCITYVGVWVCLTKSIVPGPARISLSGLFLTIALFIISLIVSIQSIMDWRNRNKTIEIVTKRKTAD